MADADRTNGPGWGAPSADAGGPTADVPSDTVSREELKKVIAERDAYKKRLRDMQQRIEHGSDDPDDPGQAESAPRGEPAAGRREETLRRKLAEKDRAIARLLIDNEIAEVAAKLGAFDPKTVTTLTRDLFTVKDGRVLLADTLEDAGLARFDDQGRERKLPDVVAQYLTRHTYLVRPSGAQGAGSRQTHASLPVNLHGLNTERYARLSEVEKQAIRRMAGVPDRPKVW